jgi:uncharacterized membrane protein
MDRLAAAALTDAMTTTATPPTAGESVFTSTLASGTARGPVLVAAALVAGLQAGTFFTWSTGVMPGLARVDDRTFIDAMQNMNVAIVNPLFLATFLGAPFVAAAAAVVTHGSARTWAIAGTALAVATLVVSFAGNIPLNDALEAAGPVDKIKDLAAVRADFESLWVKLNVVRCLTSAGALGALTMATLRSRG